MKLRLTGFTLIELLVVIAIIGTLSSIILSSLGTARNKASDAAIRQDLSDMSTQVELGRIPDFNANNEYGYACSTTPSSWPGNPGVLFRDAFSHSDKSVGSAMCTVAYEPGNYPPNISGGYSTPTYQVNTAGTLTTVQHAPPLVNGSFWAASVKLSNGQYFCVDETGFVGTTTGLTVGYWDYNC